VQTWSLKYIVQYGDKKVLSTKAYNIGFEHECNILNADISLGTVDYKFSTYESLTILNLQHKSE
jgi:hypothetical protein